jgi:2-polyprenyl-3-methyl-5-hydroxy-6-metoxy-1,4-benzoquinol methylase
MKKSSACNLCGRKRARFLFQGREHKIVQCPNCGLISVEEPAKAVNHKIYISDHYFERKKSPHSTGYGDYLAAQSVYRSHFHKQLNKIRQNLNGGRLLDIGCAFGFFLDEARKAGFITQGIDISPKAIKFAQKKLKLNILQGPFEKSNFTANQFDVITGFEIIEHVADPVNFLKKIRRILKKHGFLFLTTPDQGSLWAKLTGRFWFSYKTPEHLYFFNFSTLRAMLEKAGFQVVRIGHDILRPFPLSHLIERVEYHYPWLKGSSQFFSKILAICHLSKIPFPIFLDRIWAVAKKSKT